MQTMEKKSSGRQELDLEIKTASLNAGIPLNILSKLHSYMREVKKSVDDNPLVMLSSIAYKHGVTKDFNEALVDSGYVSMDHAGKPTQHKEWEGGEVTVQNAVKLYNEHKLAKIENREIKKLIPKKKKEPSRNYRTSFNDLMQERIEAVEGDHPEKVKAMYLYMQKLREEVEANPDQGISGLEKPFRIHTVHVAAVRRLGYLTNRGSTHGLDYEWTGGEITIEMAEKAFKLGEKQRKQSARESNERRKKAQERKKVREAVEATMLRPTSDFDLDALVDTVPGDHGETVKRIYLMLFEIRETCEEPNFSLTRVSSKYKVHGSYVARLADLNIITKLGLLSDGPSYVWAPDEPTIEMAERVHEEGLKVINPDKNGQSPMTDREMEEEMERLEAKANRTPQEPEESMHAMQPDPDESEGVEQASTDAPAEGQRKTKAVEEEKIETPPIEDVEHTEVNDWMEVFPTLDRNPEQAQQAMAMMAKLIERRNEERPQQSVPVESEKVFRIFGIKLWSVKTTNHFNQ